MAERILEIMAEAAADAREARIWYAERSAQAAKQFNDDLEDGIAKVAEAPMRWPKHSYGTRRYRLKQFPYLIVYRVQRDRVRIIAVQHSKRRPSFWRGRK
jgi:plasmid stabilization system protein ParE